MTSWLAIRIASSWPGSSSTSASQVEPPPVTPAAVRSGASLARIASSSTVISGNVRASRFATAQ